MSKENKVNQKTMENVSAMFGDPVGEDAAFAVNADDFYIVDYGLSDNDIDEVEVVDGKLRIHLMSSDLPYIEHTKGDVISMAKAISLTADDLK